MLFPAKENALNLQQYRIYLTLVYHFITIYNFLTFNLLQKLYTRRKYARRVFTTLSRMTTKLYGWYIVFSWIITQFYEHKSCVWCRYWSSDYLTDKWMYLRKKHLPGDIQQNNTISAIETIFLEIFKNANTET